MDVRRDAEHGAEGGDELSLRRLDGIKIAAHIGLSLDVDIERIGIVDAVDEDLIVGFVAVIEEHRLDLRREDVDAADDEHIVAAAQGLTHLDERSAARAGLSREHADIFGAVAKEGEGFLVERGEDEFALAPFGEHFARFGVNDLGIEVIFADVHARLLFAFEGDAGAGDLRKAVDVIRLDAELFFELLPHLLRPSLRAEDARAQLDLIAQALLFDGFCKIEGIGRGAAEEGRLQIDHELHLSVGIARRGGDGEAAHLVRAAVEPGAAREQPVAVAHLHDVLVGAARGDDGARTAFFPDVEVFLRVEGDDALARRARSRLDADAALQGGRKKTIGVRFAQVVLCEEGEQADVVEALDVLGRDALFFHLFAVVGHVVVDVLHLL